MSANRTAIGTLVSPGYLTEEFESALNRAMDKTFASRLFAKDADVFGKSGSARDSIANRLGWVDIATQMRSKLTEIESVVSSTLNDVIKQVVVLGMGGSSLAPEVFQKLFGPRKGLSSVDVLDSTDPDTIAELKTRLQLSRTLFIVSSKSGRTVETLSQAKYFIEQVKAQKVPDVGSHFMAVTDSGSDLQKLAHKHSFRHVFVNPSNIGGRYSALSYFGLVPAAFTDVDLNALIEAAIAAEHECAEDDNTNNSGLRVGALWAAAADAGRNKLTFVTTKSVASFVPWIEQLVAESTGKEGTGIVPIEGESIGTFPEYNPDRLYVFMKLDRDNESPWNKLLEQVQVSNVPYILLTWETLHELGFEFVRQEVATATAGYLLNINPFDEPNVQESKDNTSAVLNRFESENGFSVEETLAEWDSVSLLDVDSGLTSEDVTTPGDALRKFFVGMKSDSYVSILMFTTATPETETECAALRTTLRKNFGIATLRGFGPRYLHSIGQLYKGGPAQGRYIYVLSDPEHTEKIPEAPYSFGDLIYAQALGDIQALVKRKLPVLVLRSKSSTAALRLLRETVEMEFDTANRSREIQV